MGGAHRTFFREALKSHTGKLAMDSLPFAGVQHTDSRDPKEPVTDSAAAGTAIATGVKTLKGAVGVDSDGRRVRSVLEAARDRGRATGLVTTSRVTDATPASLAAHTSDRGRQSEIARQYLEQTRPDVILGGSDEPHRSRRPADRRRSRRRAVTGVYENTAIHDRILKAAGLR